jgi:hypothetical protein
MSAFEGKADIVQHRRGIIDRERPDLHIDRVRTSNRRHIEAECLVKWLSHYWFI